MTFAQYSPVFNLSVSSTRNAVKNYGFDSPQKEFIQLPEIFVSTAISKSALAIQKYLPDMIARMNQWVISTGRFSEVNPVSLLKSSIRDPFFSSSVSR